MKSYSEYMPTKEKETLLQVKISESKHEKIHDILKKEGWSLKDFVNGLVDKFLDDYQNGKKRIG